jgi:general secretion pathway protein G
MELRGNALKGRSFLSIGARRQGQEIIAPNKGNQMNRIINRARAARRDEAGFTLIELLIVIVILGVLAAIVAFSVRGVTETGDEAACEANVKTARTAIEAYYANDNNRTYPATLGALVPDFLATDPSDGSVDAKVRVNYAPPAAAGGAYTLSGGTAC